MLIVANWKAYVEDLSKAKSLFAVAKKLTRVTRIQIVLGPPAALLGALAVKNRSKVSFAAQDVSKTTGGAKTGENTAAALEAAGASYVIIGHSERRALGETEALLQEKLARVFAQGLTPILCIGEHERDGGGRYLSFIREQLSVILKSLTTKERTKLIIAYEPLWAIGKDAAAAITSADLHEMVLYIRKVLAEFSPLKQAQRSIILYGGSVEPGNIRGLAGGSGVDGFLIGHASVEPSTFKALVQELA